jgi:hypothetical protein
MAQVEQLQQQQLDEEMLAADAWHWTATRELEAQIIQHEI